MEQILSKARSRYDPGRDVARILYVGCKLFGSSEVVRFGVKSIFFFRFLLSQAVCKLGAVTFVMFHLGFQIGKHCFEIREIWVSNDDLQY